MKTKRKRIIAAMVAGVVVFIGWCYSQSRPAPLWGAQSVEAYRVIDEDQYEQECQEKGIIPHWPLPGPAIQGMHIVEGPVRMNADYAKRVNMELLNPEAFAPSFAACRMRTNYILRVERGGDTMDCLLCFHCRQLVAKHGARSWDGNLSAGFAKLVYEPFPVHQ